MPHDATDIPEHDKLVPAQEYEVEELARKYDLSAGHAGLLIMLHGPTRAKLDEIMASAGVTGR